MKFTILVLLAIISIAVVVCDSERDEKLTVDRSHQPNERLREKFGDIGEEKLEEYRQKLREKLDLDSFDNNRESFKGKLNEKLAEMKQILENALPHESEWFNMDDKKDEL